MAQTFTNGEAADAGAAPSTALPLDRRLARAEIHQAYKRAAKIMHPDGGGDAQSFCELAAARDALMKPGRTNSG
jgi:hypothetical protein